MHCPICNGKGCMHCSGTGRMTYHVYNETNERYTPKNIINLVKKVLGTIDLDPASNEAANKVVGANHYFTRQDNGLVRSWYGNVFCNPPFGRLYRANGGYQKLFIDKAIQEYNVGHMSSGILLLLGNIIFTSVGRDLWEYPLCTWQDRVTFYNERGEECQYNFGILFMYVGLDYCRFRDVFSPYGKVILPV